MNIFHRTFSRPFYAVILSLGMFLTMFLAPASSWASNDMVMTGSQTDGHAPTAEEAAQEAAAAGEPVVVDSLTTPTDLTLAKPDGTFQLEVSSEPVRMNNENGWENISTRLVTTTVDGEERLVPERAPISVSLGTEGTPVMAKLANRHGASVVQSWPFGDLPRPVIDGDTATYSGVLPGVDLVQVVHQSGVSQVLKIYSAEAARDPRVAQMRFFLDAEHVTVKDNAPGSGLSAVDASGQVALHTAEGQWWDSSWEGASAKDPGGPGLSYPFALSLGNENGRQTQIFGMQGILNAPHITYPIYVDPDWDVDRTSYVYVDSYWPTTSYWNGQYTDASVHVGYLPAAWDYTYGVSHVTRGFYQFNTSGLVGKKILAAQLQTTEVWSPSCTARAVSAYYTGNVGTGTTWNAQPTFSTKLQTQTVAKGNSASCPAGAVGFDMMAAKTQLAADSVWTVGLRADNESDGLGWKRFSNTAKIIVDYDTPPSTPTIYTITRGLWEGTPWASRYVTRLNKPTYTVRASDPDGTVGGNITVTMTVKVASTGIVKDSGTTALGSPTSGTLFSLAGSNALADGSYILEAYAKDKYGYTSGTMSFAFTVDTTPPAPPKIVPPPGTFDANGNDADGVVGQTPYTFTLSDGGKYGLQGFIYSVTSGPASPTLLADSTCGKRLREYVVVCPAGDSTTVTIAAVDETTTLTVWAFDTAGNVNTQVYGAAASYTFSSGVTAPLPNTVLPVNLNGGAQWQDIETINGTPAPNSCTGGVTDKDPDLSYGQALEVTSPGAYASTSGAAVDPSLSFSLSGWVCPTSVPATVQAAITQMAGPGSPGAALRIDDGYARFDGWTSINSGTKDSVVYTPKLAAGAWSFISAVYDATNKQMRITVTNNGYTGTWTTATSTGSHLAAAASQPVLLGASDTAGADQFSGQIYHPVLAQGVLTAKQFINAQNQFGRSMGVLK
ncbi:hypothetical protein [Arthrobacter sp. NPDC056727]|uniref:hypothetical protein n=1 Tax=Arthrobacter sp. NPDC056727 TaxID=3345927 RepID=UPI003671E20F